MKATSILVVAEVAPTRQFFCDILDFTVTVEVPHGDLTGFCILTSGDAEIMIQSMKSIADDMVKLAETPFRSMLYLDVPDVAALSERLASEVEIVVPFRKTFYGANEIFVKEPGGNIIGFSTSAGPS